MEEKREIKISLGTVICIVIIVILLCALAFVYYLGFVKEDNKEIAKPQDNEIVFQEEKTNTVIQENIIEEKKEDDKQKIINILKNVNISAQYGEVAYFDVLKINYENEEYNVEVEYNKPIIISQNQFNNLKKDKKITLNNEEYEYVTDTDSINGYIQKGNQKYEVINYSNGYAFILSGTAGGYIWAINEKENMKFVADEDTLIYDSFVGQEYKLKDNKSKDWLNRSLENTIIRLRYSEEVGLSIFIDNK